ncbi:peptidoglycan-binding protein [Candidatus Gracilibacteria bacterium]|nr:peptidoglycan-binding protein [Candidatus Gracilibacteria bacterium]
MYSSFHNTSSTLSSTIRSDIFSLLGNSGKTIFSPETFELSFSLRFFFSKSIHKIADLIEKIAYKKPLTYLTLCIVTLMVSPNETSFAAEGIERTFIITAYYSPLQGQQTYYRGSYEADVRLNGNGTHGASGTPVFTGMIAAPKTYAFGTQIFFAGLGLGTVQDRGGAIVDAYVRGQPYDRIDIWMGYGETALKRTIAWGRRTVKGTIVTSSKAATINLSGIDNGSVDLRQYPPVGSVSVGTMSADVISAFADLGYNFTSTDTKSMIVEFQLDQGIISSREDTSAGVYGPKTRSTLATLHMAYIARRQVELDAIENAKQKLLADHDSWQQKYTKAENTVAAFGQPQLRESSDAIRSLQNWLAKGQYYSGTPDGQMRPRTLLALRKYQKTKNIKATGKLDEATQTAMIDDMTSL